MPPPTLGGPTNAGPLVTELSLADVGIDAATMDRALDPCADFYAFSCGGFSRDTKLADYEIARARAESLLLERRRAALLSVVEPQAAAPKDAVTKRLAGFFAACLDEDGIEERGLRPVFPRLTQALRAKDERAGARALAELHRVQVGALFRWGVAHEADSARQTLSLLPPRLSLGAPSGYVDAAPEAERRRQELAAHIERTMGAAGLSDKAAKQAAIDVLAVETALARALLAPPSTPRHFSRAELESGAPRFAWDDYLRALGAPAVRQVYVGDPRVLDGLRAATPLLRGAPWQTYLAFQLIDELAPVLPKVFRRAAAAGAPRKEQCLDATNETLAALTDEALLSHRPEGERVAQVTRFIAEIGRTLGGRGGVGDDAQRSVAKNRLQSIGLFVGHAGRGAEDDGAPAGPSFGDYVVAAREGASQRLLARIGAEPNHDVWPPGAFSPFVSYDPEGHQLVVPGIALEAPLFDPKVPLAANAGGLGTRLAQGLLLAMDPKGSMFPNACASERFVALGGGVANTQVDREREALSVVVATYKRLREGAAELIVADGFDETQQLLLAYAQTSCRVARDGSAAATAQRVNAVVSSLAPFSAAFHCAAGAPLHSACATD